MESIPQVSLTDFVYAVVAGAAFQNIELPLLSYANGLILVCFLVLIDDWVLYHLQAAAIENTSRTFATRLTLDLIVLLIWYGAAIKAQEASAGLDQFCLLLCCFYVATSTWEIVFLARTRVVTRLVSDASAVVYLATLAGLLHWRLLDPLSPWIAVSILPLGALRLPIWKRIVFGRERIEGA